jgi:hypothetical protein
MKEQLEKVMKYNRVGPVETGEIFMLYKMLVNPSFLSCSSCPSSIRQAHKGLKEYYKQNYGN